MPVDPIKFLIQWVPLILTLRENVNRSVKLTTVSFLVLRSENACYPVSI